MSFLGQSGATCVLDCIYTDARDQACFMLLKCCVLCVAKDSFRETLCRTKGDGISCAPGLECLRGAQKNESCCGFGVPLVSGEPTLPPSSSCILSLYP